MTQFDEQKVLFIQKDGKIFLAKPSDQHLEFCEEFDVNILQNEGINRITN